MTDGLLSFPSAAVTLCLCVCSVFGHISYRSDWELVKVDFRQSFSRQCADSDYESWGLTDLQVKLSVSTQLSEVKGQLQNLTTF